jgi:hypothetical protein
VDIWAHLMDDSMTLRCGDSADCAAVRRTTLRDRAFTLWVQINEYKTRLCAHATMQVSHLGNMLASPVSGKYMAMHGGH